MTGKGAAVFALAAIAVSVTTVMLLDVSLSLKTLGLITYVCFLPISTLGVYMWATGNGYRWINGPDWKGMNDEQTRFCVSKIGLYMTAGITMMTYGIASMLYSFPMGLIFLAIAMAAGLVLTLYPVLRYSKASKIGNVRFQSKGARTGWTAAVLATAIIVIPTAAIFNAMDDSSEVEIALDGTSMRLKGPFVNETISYNDMTSLSLDEDFDRGRRVNGLSDSNMQSGAYRNSSGDYTLSAYRSCPSCIVLVTADGSLYAFNQQTEGATSELYTAIKERAGL